MRNEMKGGPREILQVVAVWISTIRDMRLWHIDICGS
jgi:hypothetical protein